MSQQTVTPPTNTQPTSPQPRRRRRALLPTTEEREALVLVKKWYDEAKRTRLSFERQWYTNMAFYFGRQYVQWTGPARDNGLNRLYEPPVPPWRARLVSNKVKPIIRKELAKVVKEKPQPFVIPASTDDDDLAAARAGEAIFDHHMRVLHMDRIGRRMTFWKLLCGTAFIKDWYDPSLRDDEGIEGSVCLEVVNPFQILVPDVQEEELENQPWCIHELAKDPDWVEEVYGKRVEPNTNVSSGLLEQKFLTQMGGATPNNKFVAVRECWVKPSPRWEEGVKVTWAGDQILDLSEGWPFGYKDFPFTKFDHVPTGAFYAASVIEDLIPLQKEYNRTRSQIIEAKNRMSKPQLVAARGSVDSSKITSEPGLVIYYTPGFQPPQPIPLVNLPGYVVDELQRCQGDMDDIAGQHEISKGHAPTGVSAATAISFLQEQDDAMVSPTISNFEEGIARIGRHILTHVGQFWEAERTVRTLGENNAWEVFVFNKAALRGNTDLNVQAGSATPRSQAAKQAFIMEMMDKKYLPPERGLRYLNMAETNRMYEEMQVSARQAQRENLRMANGDDTVTVNQYDEHVVHLEEHAMHMRRQAFERYPDEIKQIIVAHYDMHKQVMGLQQGTPIAPGEELPPAPEGGAPDPLSQPMPNPDGQGGMPMGAQGDQGVPQGGM